MRSTTLAFLVTSLVVVPWLAGAGTIWIWAFTLPGSAVLLAVCVFPAFVAVVLGAMLRQPLTLILVVAPAAAGSGFLAAVVFIALYYPPEFFTWSRLSEV